MAAIVFGLVAVVAALSHGWIAIEAWHHNRRAMAWFALSGFTGWAMTAAFSIAAFWQGGAP